MRRSVSWADPVFDIVFFHSSPDPLCLSNASLHALQNLQPWAEEQAAAAAAAAAQAREAPSLLSPSSPTRPPLASPGLA